MTKYEYSVVKCDPGLIEKKLNEHGKNGWRLKNIALEQQVHKLSSQIISASVLFLERPIEEPKK